MILAYRTCSELDDLKVGECTVRAASRLNAPGRKWWHLWFYVARETDGVAELFEVPINVNGAYAENGLGGRTWGCTKVAEGVWQIAPSIDIKDVLGGPVAHRGGTLAMIRSIWHSTPTIVNVPSDARWIHGDP